MEKNPTIYLVSIVIISLLIFFPGGCTKPDSPFHDNWVKSAQEGTLTMAPGYDANWDGPPLRPISHK